MTTELDFKIQMQSGIEPAGVALMDNLAWHNIKAQVMNDLVGYLNDIIQCGGYVLITVYPEGKKFTYQLMNIKNFELLDHIYRDVFPKPSLTSVRNFC
ncbi:MAG: hypothetical protein JST58_19460 [Bacteroidetes bacterium]|nr:hypothetical protein [Bacteroidota bacterium]